MKSCDKISTYNIDFMYHTSQLGQRNSVLYYCYYQWFQNQIQNPISTQEQEKPTLFQDIYTLAMIINHCYQEYNHKYHQAKQVKKKTLESHFWKQGKTFSTGNVTAFQNNANTSLVALSTKSSLSKLSLSPAPKKQSNSLQIDLSSKLASNSKLTSDKHKKCLKNNLCLYYGTRDHKYYDTVKSEAVIFFIYSLRFYIGFYFGFTFLLLY